MFEVFVDPRAEHELDEIAVYLASYDERFAREQIAKLRGILQYELADHPLRWSYFPLTGAPYRARLFAVGRHTQFWIIYTVDEGEQTVTVLRFWNVSRDPASIDLQSDPPG